MKRILLLIAALLLCAVACAESWTLGYAARSIPADYENTTLYVAGYRQGWAATGVLDEQQAKAVFLSDGETGVCLVSVDCVALGADTVSDIRARLSEFTETTGCPVHLIATHDHAGADTLGLWGPLLRDGKNPQFMEDLKNACVEAVLEAYENRAEGELLFGQIDTGSSIQEDTRRPLCYDSNLYCLKFVPEDCAKNVVRLVNYAAHAESLDQDNALISADYPRVVADTVRGADGSEVVWFPGAVGGLIRTRFLYADRQRNCKETGQRIAEKLLSIDTWESVAPRLAHRSTDFTVPCENVVFLAMQAAGILRERVNITEDGILLRTEMTRLTLGDLEILLIPGEVFPEVVYPALNALYGEDLLIFGLSDDEIGYIVPESDFLLNPDLPYLERQRDETGEDHYEETNSVGPDAAQALLDAAASLIE